MAQQLTMEERETISRMQAAGRSPAETADAIGRHVSTIYRELARNASPGGYRAVAAQQMALQRRRDRPITRKMERPEIRENVIKHLVQYWSPEQIAGRTCRTDGVALVSHQTIYDWIRRDENWPR